MNLNVLRCGCPNADPCFFWGYQGGGGVITYIRVMCRICKGVGSGVARLQENESELFWKSFLKELMKFFFLRKITKC